jgi:tape measure domain-containing protein
MAQNIVFKVSADTTGIKTGMEQAGQATKKVSKEVSDLEKQFTTLGGIIVGAFSVSALIDFGREVTRVTAQVQSLTIRMQDLTGSETLAVTKLQELRIIAEKLGLEFKGLTDSYVQFVSAAKASGMEVAKADKIFKSMSVAVAGSGVSADKAQRAMVALTQMIGKQKISAEELNNQLGEAMPAAIGIMAKSMGVGTKELFKMMEQGQVLSNEVLPKFAEEMEKAFGGNAEKLADSLQANLNRLENAWTDLYLTVGNTGLSGAGIKTLTLFVNGLENAFVSLQFAAATVQTLIGNPAAVAQFMIQQQTLAAERYRAEQAIQAEKYATHILDSEQNETIEKQTRILENRARTLQAGIIKGNNLSKEEIQNNIEIEEKIKAINNLITSIAPAKKQQKQITDAELKAIEKKRIELEKINQLELDRLTEELKASQIDPFESQLAEATYDAEQEAKRQKNVEKMLGEIGQENSKLNDLRNAQGDYEILEAKRIADEKADIAKQEKALRIQLAESTFSGIASLANAYYQNDLAKQTESLNERRKKGEIGEEEYANAVRRIKRKALIADKIAALSQIAISTAVNIASIQNGTALGLLTPLYLTNAAIQTGLVLAQPVPYNKGTKRVPMMRNAVRGKDSVHAILTPDERVVPADINSQPGYSALLDLAHDRKITNEEAGMIASIAMGSSRFGAGSNIDSDALGRSIAKHLPTTSVNINDRGIAIITERSQSEIRRLKTRIG